mmetsp:Transcript_21581/g.60001  ORF Transcript_21581/g.60001 Transcript_21581/m.60001 type:complete len:112 (+) Transcript_21581:788-1123(+)
MSIRSQSVRQSVNELVGWLIRTLFIRRQIYRFLDRSITIQQNCIHNKHLPAVPIAVSRPGTVVAGSHDVVRFCLDTMEIQDEDGQPQNIHPSIHPFPQPCGLEKDSILPQS